MLNTSEPAGTVVAPPVLHLTGNAVGKVGEGTIVHSKAAPPVTNMAHIVQNLQLQWRQELIGLQQQAHNIAQVRLEAERRKMQQQQLVELKDQQLLLEKERQRLELEKAKWLDDEKKKLGDQMEQRLEQERRRLEQHALGQFIAAEGPLDRPLHTMTAGSLGAGGAFAADHAGGGQEWHAASLCSGDSGIWDDGACVRKPLNCMVCEVIPNTPPASLLVLKYLSLGTKISQI